MPARHPFRVYLQDEGVQRVVDPTFEAVEQFYLEADDDEEITLRGEDGEFWPCKRSYMLSLLSAAPDDQERTEATANGHSEAEHPDREPVEVAD